MFRKAIDRYIAPPAEPYVAKIQADRLRILYGALPISLLTSLINAAILSLVQSLVISAEIVTSWMGAIVVLTAWRFAGYYRFTHYPPPSRTMPDWTRRFLIEAFGSGILWGAAAFLLFPPADLLHQMFLVFVLAGMGAGAATTLSAMWIAALAYLVPALLPLIVNLFLAETPLSLPMGFMASLFLVMVSLSALRARNTLVELLHARHVQAQADTDLRLCATTFRSQEGILIADRIGRILQLNEAACRMIGYPEKALAGHPVRKLLAPNLSKEHGWQAMRNALNASGFWAGDCRLLTHTGTEIPVRATATAVHDQTGVLSHYVGHVQDMSTVQQAQARIEFQAYYDALTNLPNRWLLSERLNQDVSRSHHHGSHGAVLFIGLDHFKRINEALGHRVGDELLKSVARRLIDNIRSQDLAARFGGDEFVVMLTGLNEDSALAEEEVRQYADKLQQVLGKPHSLAGNHLHITTSLGIAVYPKDAADAATILTQADTALYQAKEGGRNAQAFYRPCMQDSVRTRLDMEIALRRALDENEFHLVYQPQVDHEGHTVGVEALLRWLRPGYGRVAPSDFIPVAEDSSLILPIGDWVLKTACETLARWQRMFPGKSLPPLSINVSPRQFFQADFVKCVTTSLEAHGLTGNHLELELTEGLLLDDIEGTRTKMRELAKRGIRIALDDFGTGYSSLRYLQQLPITTLKIDRSFVHGLKSNDGNAAIIRTIISMAEHLQLDVVAEGVETTYEAQLLNTLGCRVHQGYLYGAPLDEKEFRDWLEPASPTESLT